MMTDWKLRNGLAPRGRLHGFVFIPQPRTWLAKVSARFMNWIPSMHVQAMNTNLLLKFEEIEHKLQNLQLLLDGQKKQIDLLNTQHLQDIQKVGYLEEEANAFETLNHACYTSYIMKKQNGFLGRVVYKKDRQLRKRVLEVKNSNLSVLRLELQQVAGQGILNDDVN